MPSNWLYIDTNFPSFTGEETTKEQITTIENYLFMLVEQLRYTLNNLDTTNMNATALDQFKSSITDPLNARITDNDGNILELQAEAQRLYARLTNAEGDITTLGATAQGLAARITDNEGNITNLSATAQGLDARITDNEGNIASLTATAQGLGARLSSAEGDITSLNATAQGILARISNAEGDITSLFASAQGIQTRVSNAEGNITTLTQTVNGFQLTATDNGSSTTLTLTSSGIEVTTSMGSVQAAKNRADSAYTRAGTAISRASSALDDVAAIAAGTYQGTFINGKKIYSPSIYAGSAGSGGGQIVGIDSNGITVYDGTSDMNDTLKIYMSDREAWVQSGWDILNITSPSGIKLSSPYIYIGSNAAAYRTYFYGTVDFSTAAGVDGLTVYFG